VIIVFVIEPALENALLNSHAVIEAYFTDLPKSAWTSNAVSDEAEHLVSTGRLEAFPTWFVHDAPPRDYPGLHCLSASWSFPTGEGDSHPVFERLTVSIAFRLPGRFRQEEGYDFSAARALSPLPFGLLVVSDLRLAS
jgi:hypothetical protein